MTLLSPPIHLASPRMVIFLASLGGLKKKWQDPRGLVWQHGAVAVCDHPLNCQSGSLRSRGEYLFPGRKCLHICKGIHWWQIKGSPAHHGKDMVMASLLVVLILLHGPLCPTVWTHLEFQFTSTVFVNGHQIKQPRQTETWNQYLERGPHPHSTKQPEQPWRSRGIWECPIPITIPVSSKETWLPWDLVLPGNAGDLHWRWESSTSSITPMGSVNCGRHGEKCQSWPNRSHSDRSRLGHLILCAMVIRRRTEFGQGMRCHVYAVRWNQLGCQATKPGWWSVADCPSHHWRTHWTKRAQSSSFNTTCFNTI